MKKKLIIAGLTLVASLVFTPVGNEAQAKKETANNGNHYGWTKSNGNHYGLVKQGKIKEQPSEQVFTYTAADIMTNKVIMQENQTILFEGYTLKYTKDSYTVLKNDTLISTGLVLDTEEVWLHYDPAGTYIALTVNNNNTGYWNSVPLILAYERGEYSGLGNYLSGSEYRDTIFLSGYYVNFNKETNTVTITKDGLVIEEYHYPKIDRVLVMHQSQTDLITLEINDVLVYTFDI
ncbi:hypothetical protein [Bacillus sp. EB01]|uniref:hypothetical protein n=1 Tax=Bacillus sp. EB01 TaxID=1347086 RepID=UPI0005C5DC8C|nr:hypothetical protein [Bacillus sp. EB01]